MNLFSRPLDLGMIVVRDHRQLRVYRLARDGAMRIYEVSRAFPSEERYSLTDQIRRSSRSVCANLAEGWQKRRYAGAFTAKVLDAAGEADETRVWLDFAKRCGFLADEDARDLEDRYDKLVASLVLMATHPADWRIGA